MKYTDPIIAAYMAANPVPAYQKFTVGRGTTNARKGYGNRADAPPKQHRGK